MVQIKKREQQGERGTQNELEIIKLILEENPVLRKRVLDKLRVGKASYLAREKRKLANAQGK